MNETFISLKVLKIGNEEIPNSTFSSEIWSKHQEELIVQQKNHIKTTIQDLDGWMHFLFVVLLSVDNGFVLLK